MERLAAEAGAALAAANDPQPAPERGTGGTSPYLATAGATAGSRPADHVPPTALERVLLRHCLDEEETTEVERPGEEGPEDDALDEAGLEDEALEEDALEEQRPDEDEPDARRSDVPALPAQLEAPDRLPVPSVPAVSDDRRAAGSTPSSKEPRYLFSARPTMAKLRSNTDKFYSSFMESIVRTWPQAPVTALSRKAHAAGLTCSGATDGASKRTNVERKTWALRISVAMRFANFIGRTICLPADGPRPSDTEIDRGVAKFFACLNLATHEVINLFLDARREGLHVAGGGGKIMERTIKGYSAAIGFFFADARIDGVTGPKLAPDCVGYRSPWQKKGLLELEQERKTVRDDPGTYIGNPMDAESIKTHKGAAEKEARKSGQHNTTSADVTPKMLSLLYDALVRKHLAAPAGTSATAASGAGPTVTGGAATAAHEATSATPVTAAPDSTEEPEPETSPFPGAEGAESEAAHANLSTMQTDFLAYAFYAFLFKTLARPLTLINLKYRDVTLPDTLVPANAQFYNK